MPLVLVNKARRMRAVAAAANPYALADGHVAEVARALVAAAQSIVAPGNLEQVAASAIDVVPWFDSSRPQTVAAWDALSARLSKALTAVVSESARIAKDRPNIPTIPVNPRSIEWARQRGGRLIRGISADTRETIRRIVARGVERGHRADTMANAIRRSVGLLPSQEAAVDRRRELLLEQDIPTSRVEALSDKYARDLLDQRAERIARTETVAAQNRGLLGTWQEAQADGALPAGVVRVWAAAPPSDNPSRPCPICIELDDQAVGLDEPFQSDELGESVMTPPAHPNCRCTMTLKRSGE